jgi:hypothetical protein
MKKVNWWIVSIIAILVALFLFGGGMIYFCTRACLRVFEQDPDPFMVGEVEHPTHEDE